MSIEALSEEQERELAYQRHRLIEPHRSELRSLIFDEASLVNSLSRPTIECWTSEPRVVKSLLDLLPFGLVFKERHFEDFLDYCLPLIPDASREQLLYWHLESPLAQGAPVQTLILCENETQLWQGHILPRHQEYQQALLGGERLRFLTYFYLDHTRIHLILTGIRIRSLSETFGRVSSAFALDGDSEYTYLWNNRRWERNANVTSTSSLRTIPRINPTQTFAEAIDLALTTAEQLLDEPLSPPVPVAEELPPQEPQTPPTPPN